MCTVLGGCAFGPGMHAQITSFNVAGCDAEAVLVSKEVYDLDSNETWIAECNGVKYTCNYFPEADSGCYELVE